MKTIMLKLLDQDNQPLKDVPLEEYAIPSAGEEVNEELDNTVILKRVSELMDAVFVRISQLNAEPVEPPVHVRIKIGDALLWASETPGPTIEIPIKVKVHAEA